MVTIRPMTGADWDAVASIYAEGLATGLASFETEVPAWRDWDAAHLEAGRLVAEADGVVVGWVAVAPVSRRACYSGVVEHSVYVAADRQSRGVGRSLLEELVAVAPEHGIWTIQTSIMAGNLVSIALHERCGFRRVGYRERIGQRDGTWHDTVLLERRLT